MANKKSFILHDETVNTYGFRMLTSGANLEEFRKNPVMLLNHEDYSLPIGRWENIRIVGTQILADPVFDMRDPVAAKVAGKVEDDFLRMASIGAWPPEEKTDDPMYKLAGQTGPTVTKWTVREASIVNIGANHNALALYDRTTGKPIDMADTSAVMRLIDRTLTITSKKERSMSVLTQILKLSDGGSEAEVEQKVREIIANSDRLAQENKTLRDAIDKQNNERKQQQKEEAVRLLDAAVKDGRIQISGKDPYLKFFDADFDAAKQALEAIPMRSSISSAIVASHATVDLSDIKSKSWDELDKANKLTVLKDQAPELYAEKFKERFGVQPNM